ncbi:MAG: hypothetical protein JW801_06160 [Bacteroidales bacterium]|nr:hypothetical protein [Bacteroidales bacterium]
MKRFMLFSISALMLVFLFTNCKGPKRIGKKMGKITCEQRELNKEASDLRKELYKLDQEDEDDRKEIEDIQIDLLDIQLESMELSMKAMKLNKALLKKYDDEKAYDDYEEELEKAMEEYIKDKCYDKEVDGD